MNYKIVSFLIFLLSAHANAECFVAGEFAGSSARAESSLRLKPDQMSGKSFKIDVNGENSKVSPSNMSCLQAGENTILCVDTTKDGKSVIEAWAVHPTQGKVTYTKAINGYAEFDGGNLLIGKITGKCH